MKQPISAFIYNAKTFQVLATGTWDTMEAKGQRMLHSLRQHGNLQATEDIHLCTLWSNPTWDPKLKQPKFLQSWLQQTYNQETKPYTEQIALLNPHRLSIRSIPTGDYCYTFVQRKGDTVIPSTKPCPYYDHPKIAGVTVAWCHFLKLGGTINGTTRNEYRKLRKHLGKKKEQEMLPLFLLWDGCKECGVKRGHDTMST